MLEWKVRYYKGTTQLEEVTSTQLSWEELPTENIVDVEITNGEYTHILRGMDNYWISGSTYGMFNNTGSLAIEEEELRNQNGHQEVVYEGEEWVEYEWSDVHIRLTQQSNSPNKYILKGVMIPDEHAILFGLI
jgi:hypothetical protein